MADGDPFLVASPLVPDGCRYLDSASRLRIVREADATDLRLILAMDDVQKTVRQAAERRLRALERGAREA